MQAWNRNWRLAAICIVASLFFWACNTAASAQAAPPIQVSTQLNSAMAFPASTPLAQMRQIDLNDAVRRGSGGYLSWIKLALMVVVFLIWVAMSDRINQDALRYGKLTGMNPEVWNTINVAGFVLAFFLAISIPIFWIGYPVYVLAAFVPPICYYLVRRGHVKASSTLSNQIAANKAMLEAGETGRVVQIVHEPLPQDEGAEVEFSAAGDDKAAQQSNLIRARQTIAFPVLKDMIADALGKRGEVMLLDFTAQAVTGKMQVDGSWHAQPTLDRETGDALLASMKFLAALNPQDRRSRQRGKFGFKYNDTKGQIEIISQGVQTGERVQVKLIQKSKLDMNLGQLGMWPEMFDKLLTHLNQPGMVIVSGPPGEGLSTSWRATIMAADRVTRDCVSFVDESNHEHDFENVTRNDVPTGQPPFSVMHRALLAQPDCLVVPDPGDKATMDELTRQVIEEQRSVYVHVKSRSASEALLRMYALAGDKQRFAEAVTAVTCQKLTRRLCETCKQQVQVDPKLIQKLGGNPNKQNWLYNHFTGPPPGAVDEKGEPIEIPPCKTCSAFGYIGRIAFFELIEVSDPLRKVLIKQPKVETIAAAAQKLGNLSLAQQAYRLALVGLTSVSEIQRSLKS